MIDYKVILEKAFQAGKEALEKTIPAPVHFYSADLFDRPLDKGSIGFDCGVAWLDYIDGKSEFVRWSKKNIQCLEKYGIRFQKSLYKGYELAGAHSSIYNDQSIDKKEAFYVAYSKVLKEYGIKATVKTILT